MHKCSEELGGWSKNYSWVSLIHVIFKWRREKGDKIREGKYEEIHVIVTLVCSQLHLKPTKDNESSYFSLFPIAFL